VLEVLTLSAYRRLLAAYTLNELAWPIGTVALAVLVYRRTGSAVGAMAYFLCAQFVPALIAPALVGRIDRLDARAALPALYLLEAGAFLALGWLASRFSLTAVLVLTLADGVLALSARAISRAETVAVTSPAGLLREGNALANACFSVCFMAGPAIGGAVVAAGGTAAALFINSGLFVAVALTIATARGLPRAQPQPEGSRGRLRAALAHAREHPLIRALLGVQAVAVLFFTISTPVEIVLVQHSLHGGAGGYGALVSAWGAGSLAGSAVYARWRRWASWALIALGAALLGAGFIVMAAAPSLAIVIAGAALAGVGNGVEAVAARTALQEAVQPQWMALIMSLNESIFQAMTGIGFALGGALAALAGPRAALAVGGAGSLAVIVLAWLLLAPGPAARRPSQAAPSAPESAACSPPAEPAARR
jgi:predicted MFS family arabinose efflux permease